MTTVPRQRTEYRIDDLARAAGTTVRNVRAYQDRGLLPPADRRGRANVYHQAHLERLRLVAQLLDRGHTLAGIKELLDAWESGRGLGGVLGLVAEVTAPWTDEEPERLSRAALIESFHGVEDEQAIADAVRLGVLEPIQDADSAAVDGGAAVDGAVAVDSGAAGDSGAPEFIVPSPGLLAVAVELHALGVPLPAIIAHLEELRGDIGHLARRFVEFSAVHIFVRYAGHQLTDAEAAEAVGTVRRLRPLAQSAVDAELARSMRLEATRMLDAAVSGPLRGLVQNELTGRP
ncbi:DNA-binding transcriptional MerR regulator [Streptacidiphilus sp. MAP12-16]|uniref:MerR family transcriptional regulator n=1 Tax=Streptacidiphilus sp. MAP12-16 TaxID=3156300 RepID=UPI003517E469